MFILFLVQFWLLGGHFWGIAAHSVDHVFSLQFCLLVFVILVIFPVLVLMAAFGF